MQKDRDFAKNDVIGSRFYTPIGIYNYFRFGHNDEVLTFLHLVIICSGTGSNKTGVMTSADIRYSNAPRTSESNAESLAKSRTQKVEHTPQNHISYHF